MKQLVFLLLLGTASAQVINGISVQRVPPANFLRAVPGAIITTCSASDTAVPCTQLVTTYTDQNLTTQCSGTNGPTSGAGCSNPGVADVNANYSVFAPSGSYMICSQASTTFCQVAGTGGASATTPTASTCPALLSPIAIHFGTIQTSSSSPTQNFTINNPCTPSFNVLGVSISGANFSSSNINICDGTLQGGATCVVPLQYNPTSGVSDSATVTVTTTAPLGLNSLTIALDGTGTATATFPLTVNCAGTGSGTTSTGESTPLINVSCVPSSAPTGVFSNNYASGATPTLTATPASGSTFVSFSGGGCSTSPCTPTISAATVITATFNVTLPTVNLNITGLGQGTGTVTSDIAAAAGIINCTSTAGVASSAGNSGCSGSYQQGQTVTLTETPLSGSSFVGWSGPCSGTATTCVIALNSTQTATANFTLIATPISLTSVFYSTNAATGTTIAGTFTTQHAAGMDVCFLETNGAVTVTGVTDTSGNTWAALNTKTTNGTINQIAYGARNIAAAASNTVTVTYSGTMTFRSMRCLSYDGIDTTSGYAETTASAGGSSATPAAGNLTTSTANDLLVCGTTSGQSVQTADTAHSYVQQILDAPFNDDAEDRQGVAIGTYNCQPTLNTSASWVSQNIAFKAVSGASHVTTIALTVVGAGQGSGVVTFSGQTCTLTAGVSSGSCSVQVAADSTPTLTASASAGSVFANWMGVTGCSTGASCTVPPISGPTQVTAVFNLTNTQNYYVNGSTGSDSNSGLCAVAGTPAGCTGPWATVQKANSSLILGAYGTTINVANGTYSGAITTTASGTATAHIRYQSTNQYGARLVGAGGGGIVWSVKGKYTDIVGFEFDGSVNTTNYAGVVTFQGGENATILNNKLHDLATGGGFRNTQGIIAGCIIIGGVPLSVPCNNIYRGNLLYHNNGGGSGATFSDGNTGLDLEWGDVAQDNIVMDQGGGYCLQVSHSATNVIVTNNTILNCARGGIVVGFGLGQTVNNSTFTNNIFANTGLGSLKGAGFRVHGDGCGSANIYANNLVYGGQPTNYQFDSCADTSTGKQSGSDSTTFVNYTSTISGDYHLKAGSTGINTGTTLCALSACVPAADFDSVSRPQGPAYDIGAYEQ